jgi:4-aminobutyrate aminotransferase-like enzyme
LGLGHNHPKVREAIVKYSGLLIHGMGDVHPSSVKVELLERIARLSPIPNSRIILGQNGCDAVESALKTARLASGKRGVIAFDGAYHGLSYGALETTSRGFFRDPFDDQRGHFAHHLPFGCDPELVAQTIKKQGDIGAVIVEPIQARGGIKIAPTGWLKALKSVCETAGAALILDEIFTGWGRTGKMFACLDEDVEPDIICVGKAMGGGMPISACIAEESLMRQAWGDGSVGEARHTYTFIGHPLSCAAACAALDAIVEENLPQRVCSIGKTLIEKLRKLAGKHPETIVDVRGRGLMIGIEFRNPVDVTRCVVAALQKGIILLPAGNFGETLEITPPYVIQLSQCDFLLNALDEAIEVIKNQM